MFSAILELILIALDKILSNIANPLLEIANDIGNNVWHGISNIFTKNYFTADYEAFKSLTLIAYTLVIVICIYGFLVENLDFHTYDGWDRVIRFFLRLVIVSILMTSCMSIFQSANEALTNTNKLILNYYNNTWLQDMPVSAAENIPSEGHFSGIPYPYWPGETISELDFTDDIEWNLGELVLNSTGSVPAIIADLVNMATEDRTALPLDPDASQVGIPNDLARVIADNTWSKYLVGGFFNISDFILVLWAVVTHLIAMIACCALVFLIIKKTFKIGINLIIPSIEFFVLSAAFPIGLSFFASHSTQHVGQGYIRWLAKTGLQLGVKGALLSAVLWVARIFRTNGILNPRFLLSSRVQGYLNQLTCGYGNVIIALAGSLILIFIADMVIEKGEHFMSKIWG